VRNHRVSRPLLNAKLSEDLSVGTAESETVDDHVVVKGGDNSAYIQSRTITYNPRK
jgi:hypothetical protein